MAGLGAQGASCSDNQSFSEPAKKTRGLKHNELKGKRLNGNLFLNHAVNRLQICRRNDASDALATLAAATSTCSFTF